MLDKSFKQVKISKGGKNGSKFKRKGVVYTVIKRMGSPTIFIFEHIFVSILLNKTYQRYLPGR